MSEQQREIEVLVITETPDITIQADGADTTCPAVPADVTIADIYEEGVRARVRVRTPLPPLLIGVNDAPS